jgi:hypothetical protein
MNKIKIANAFSLNMLEKFPTIIRINEVSEDWIKGKDFDFQSYIGHPSTAELLSARLGKKIEFNRATLKLAPGDEILVAQLMGERKEFKEMNKEEIEQYPIKYFLVSID